MERILKLKVKDLKNECLKRKLSTKGNKAALAFRLKENEFSVSTNTPPLVPILPRDNKIAENDAHSLANILKNNLHHNDINKRKKFTILNYSNLAYEKYIEPHGKKKKNNQESEKIWNHGTSSKEPPLFQASHKHSIKNGGQKWLY
jgi:hypothetical protein